MIFFNQHGNKNYLHQNFFKKGALSHFCTGPDLILFQVCIPFGQYEEEKVLYFWLEKKVPCKLPRKQGGVKAIFTVSKYEHIFFPVLIPFGN